MNNETGLIPRQTLAQMAEAWQQAHEEVKQAMELLSTAKERLRTAFGPDAYRFDFEVGLHSSHYKDPEQLMKEVKKGVWACLIQRMEMRKIMSLADNEKLDQQLRTGEGMPDITLVNLIAMIEGTMANLPKMIEGMVKEIYDWLRPWRQSDHDYVTNQKNLWQLGKKVIKGATVTHKYGGGWRANHYRQNHITALDNVFHALDGKGLPKSHYGPLTDAIEALPPGENGGETEYFRFKCYGNGNLHLEFKRQDLLDKLNAVAGGMRLGNAPNRS